ncbi:membrane-associated progesterone receptor component 1-like [Ornithodoros turicata]
MAGDNVEQAEQDSADMSWGGIFSELLSPINLILASICCYLVYKIFISKQQPHRSAQKKEPELPPMKKRDMTLSEIRKFDGTGEDGRVLVAVNGKVFDVTKGKNFYGPGGPYHAFAGHDASRGLATFSVETAKEEYDDLSDLNPMQMESVREWEMQFTEKYHYVGRLLKPGEEPTDYSDEEDAQDQTKKSEGVVAEEASGGDTKPHAD